MIIENLKKIEQELSEKNVQLVLATKGQSVETLEQVQKYKPFILGENKVQEFLSKYGHINATWHFIGTLQTNKVKYIIDKVSCIQSVSNKRLLSEINRQAKKFNLIMDIFFEINVANEDSKTGANIAEFNEMLDMLESCNNVKLRGIMGMMPNQDSSENIKFYLQLKEIYDRTKSTHHIDYLSVGMSGDYKVAIKYGSNMVRLGTAVFG